MMLFVLNVVRRNDTRFDELADLLDKFASHVSQLVFVISTLLLVRILGDGALALVTC